MIQRPLSPHYIDTVHKTKSFQMISKLENPVYLSMQKRSSMTTKIKKLSNLTKHGYVFKLLLNNKINSTSIAPIANEETCQSTKTCRVLETK